MHLLCILISVQVVFIVTHWEKYNTGVLYLSWGYDASQYVSGSSSLEFYFSRHFQTSKKCGCFQVLTLVYLFTYFVGYEWFKFYVIGGMSVAVVIESSFYRKFILISFFNCFMSY